jgi:hypothetical protein
VVLRTIIIIIITIIFPIPFFQVVKECQANPMSCVKYLGDPKYEPLLNGAMKVS